MIRITFHLSGVKPTFEEHEVKNTDGTTSFIKKKICVNTIAYKVKNREVGVSLMNTYLKNNRGQKITKHYFSNIK